MKFTAHATALKRALAFAAQVVERRNCIPVLGMVLIECDGEAITITGTDLDIECRAGADALYSTGKFSCILPPRLLTGLLRWAEGEVTIIRDGDLITIIADDVEATVREMCSVEDWPLFIVGEALGLPVSISDAKFRKALSNASTCISTEETRYYLNGVFLHDKGKGLRAVASDGHRMAIYDTGEGWGLPDAILPRKTAAVLLRALPKLSNHSITVRATMGKEAANVVKPTASVPRFEFSGDGWRVRSRVIDGAFPDYTRVIPTGEATIRATISAAALRRFPPQDSRTSRPIKIDPNAGRMSVTDPEGITISMPVQGEGGPVGFNLKYLRAFAEMAGVIRLETAKADDPCRVLTDDPALLQVIMPMRL